MKKTLLRTTTAAAAAVGLLFAASPAQAAPPFSGEVVCGMTGVYENYDDFGFSGHLGVARQGDQLTVAGGYGNAWNVQLDSGSLAGTVGWISIDCVGANV